MQFSVRCTCNSFKVSHVNVAFPMFHANRPAIPQVSGASHQTLRHGNTQPLMNSLWNYTNWFYLTLKMQWICPCWKHIPANQNCDPIHFQLDFVCCSVFRFQPSKEHAINGIFYCANGNAKNFLVPWQVCTTNNHLVTWQVHQGGKHGCAKPIGGWFHPTSFAASRCVCSWFFLSTSKNDTTGLASRQRMLVAM